MNYTDAAKVLGVDRETVIRRARRRKWGKQLGNDGKPRIAIPVSVLPTIPDIARDNFPDIARDAFPDIAANSKPSIPDIDRDRSFSAALAALREGHELVQVQLDAMRLQQAALVSQLDEGRKRVEQAEARATAAEAAAEAARAQTIGLSQRLGAVEAEANAARLAAARAARSLEQAEAARQTAEVQVASAEASTAEAEVHAAEAEREAKQLRQALAEARRPFWRRWIG